MISTYGREKKTDDMPFFVTKAYQAPGSALTRVMRRKMINVVAVVLLFGVCLTALNVYGLRNMQDHHRESSLEDNKLEKRIKNQPIEVVRDKRELEKQDGPVRDVGNIVRGRRNEVAGKKATVTWTDVLRQTKKDELATLPDPDPAVRQEVIGPQLQGTNGLSPNDNHPDNSESDEKPQDAPQQATARREEKEPGSVPLGHQSHKPVVSPKRSRRPIKRQNQKLKENNIDKNRNNHVGQHLFVQSPTVQSDLRNPPMEQVGILNQPAQQIQLNINKAPVVSLQDSKVQQFIPQFARRTLQVHEVQRQQVQKRQVQMQQQVQMPQPQGQLHVSVSPNRRSPAVWVYGSHIESGYLDHVLAVFKRIGYKRGGPETDCDVIWSHEYPFMDPKLTPHINNMKPHQKINHWPGGGYVTNKMSLATSDIHFVPQAFRLPHQKEALLLHAKTNPKKMWVQKNNNHRGIRIRPLNQLELTGESFVQEYVENPFLIDGRKFDIGIYTVITSIDPLRMYMYEEEALFRYCPKAYHPFDPNDVDKYVVAEDYTPTWEMPSLKDTYNRLQYSHKETWNHYVRSIGKDPSGVWRDIKASLREVYLTKAPLFLEQLRNFPHQSVRNFFEMVRFDYVVDEDLNIFLMEVNMSPNLSSGHTPPNKFMYEQVIFNLLHLVGVARPIPTTLEGSPDDQTRMMVSDRDIQIYPDICTSDTCRATASCTNMVCRLCEHCLTADWRDHLKAAFLEHVARRNFRRVCPVPLTQEEAAYIRPASDSKLSETNWLMDLWFRGKCFKDPAWCT